MITWTYYEVGRSGREPCLWCMTHADLVTVLNERPLPDGDYWIRHVTRIERGRDRPAIETRRDWGALKVRGRMQAISTLERSSRH